MTVARLCLLSIVAFLLFQSENMGLLGISVLLTLVAEGIGRVLFYGLHMTSAWRLVVKLCWGV